MAMKKHPRICPTCEEHFLAEYAAKKYCSRKCWLTRYNREDADGHGMRGSYAAGARNKILLSGAGTKAYRKRDGRHIHRAVAEQKIGRPLAQGEVVHHINGDHLDNRPENLQVLPSQAEHARIHNQERRNA